MGQHELRRSYFLTDLVIGMSDGLIVPFALAAGLSAVVSSTSTIIPAGLAAIGAGAAVMALSGYHAGKNEMDDSRQKLTKEYKEAGKLPLNEKEQAKTFFANIGLSEELQERALEEMVNDKKQWIDFITKYELSPGQSDPARPGKSALNIGLSYIAGGLITLSPYFFIDTPIHAFKISVVLTLVCLFIFGFFKSKITGSNPVLGAVRVTLTGAIAGGAAFGVAKLLEL